VEIGWKFCYKFFAKVKKIVGVAVIKGGQAGCMELIEMSFNILKPLLWKGKQLSLR
jgi:hypothetical protein